MGSRSGFTLVEVLVAMVLLGFAVLGVQATITDRFIRGVGQEDHRSTAHQLVADRLTEIQNDPQYSSLASRYAGTEDDLAGFDGYQRSTMFRAATGYTVVTVRVTTPAGRDTVTHTVALGAP